MDRKIGESNEGVMDRNIEIGNSWWVNQGKVFQKVENGNCV